MRRLALALVAAALVVGLAGCDRPTDSEKRHERMATLCIEHGGTYDRGSGTYWACKNPTPFPEERAE